MKITRYDCATYCDGGVMDEAPDGEFVKYSDYAALAEERANLIAEVRSLRTALSTPIAMGIKWSPIESSMMSGFSQFVAEDALTRERQTNAKSVTVYYGEKRTYTSMAAFCAAHPKEAA